MFSDFSEGFLAFLACVVATMLFAGGAAIYTFNDHTNEDMMKACVAAGKDWVRDGITSYYECK